MSINDAFNMKKALNRACDQAPWPNAYRDPRRLVVRAMTSGWRGGPTYQEVADGVPIGLSAYRNPRWGESEDLCKARMFLGGPRLTGPNLLVESIYTTPPDYDSDDPEPLTQHDERLEVEHHDDFDEAAGALVSMLMRCVEDRLLP